MGAADSLLLSSDILYHLPLYQSGYLDGTDSAGALRVMYCNTSQRNSLIKTIFALAVAGVCHPSHVFHVVTWIWLHLLTCNIANQVKAPDEDKINKPFRPLPSGRTTEHHARILGWILVPVCLAVSAAYSTELFVASMELQVLTIMYSELHCDQGFLLKNSVTALMYGCAGFSGALLA